MLSVLHYLTLAAFAVLMLAAAIEDFRRFIIPNGLVIGLCGLWLLNLAVTPSLADAVGALGCALAVFAVGALCFARGYLGGGDVKLLSAATLWVGPGATPALLALTGICGGILALFLMAPLTNRLVLGGRALLRCPEPETTGNGQPVQVPYGIAIAAAALIVILPANLT